MTEPEGVTPALEAHGVRRAFGAVQAVADASVSLPPGTVTALIGPNGCGKTTLMLMLAGLLAPDAGTITVAGHDPSVDGPLARSHVGWMPDSLGTWDSLTCLETLATFGRMYGASKDQANTRGMELLQLVHLEEFASRPARVLSRGQKQRLSLARALVHKPSVLILDEPASGLDPRSRVELRELVRGLAAQGASVLISSHVLSELDEMVDDAIFMSKGVTLGDSADALVAAARQRWRVTGRPGADVHAALSGLTRDWSPALADDASQALVQVANEDDAAELLAQLVGQGLRISAFGPVGSALEQVYLTMEEERR
ncbi:ABC transporter ATP-binding protein [Demequina sp.]|uniref:ABC transporter ATP-binding protein n=1 Tax=Demequina sp. TaxID=2050685 RepID=UPI003D102A8C